MSMLAVSVLIFNVTLVGCLVFVGSLTRVIARAWYAEKQAYLFEMTKLGSVDRNYN